MAPFFYGPGSTASRLEPLRGSSLLFMCLLGCSREFIFDFDQFSICHKRYDIRQ